MEEQIALVFDRQRAVAALARSSLLAKARARPDLVRREVGAGMVVGNHSWDHPITPPFRDLPRARIASEIRRASAELQTIGVAPQLFRPPGGSYSPWMLREAARQGVRVVLWSVDPRDWQRGVTSDTIVSEVQSEIGNGHIILLHDAGGDRTATVDALPRIIDRYAGEGYRFALVGDLLGKSRAEIMPRPNADAMRMARIEGHALSFES